MTRRKLKALIPARSGSERVTNKNLRPFCGSSLLELRVRQLLQCNDLDGVIVSSNDPKTLELVERMGAEIHLRDEMYASNSISMSSVYANMASEIECDDILYALVTTPLVTTETFEAAIAEYRALPSRHDSLTSVADVKEFMWRDGCAINYDPSNIPRSQDLPDVVRLTFSVSILPRELMITKRSCMGQTPKLIKVDDIEAIDIDTPLDFLIAEWLYNELRVKKTAEILAELQ